MSKFGYHHVEGDTYYQYQPINYVRLIGREPEPTSEEDLNKHVSNRYVGVRDLLTWNFSINYQRSDNLPNEWYMGATKTEHTPDDTNFKYTLFVLNFLTGSNKTIILPKPLATDQSWEYLMSALGLSKVTSYADQPDTIDRFGKHYRLKEVKHTQDITFLELSPVGKEPHFRQFFTLFERIATLLVLEDRFKFKIRSEFLPDAQTTAIINGYALFNNDVVLEVLPEEFLYPKYVTMLEREYCSRISQMAKIFDYLRSLFGMVFCGDPEAYAKTTVNYHDALCEYDPRHLVYKIVPETDE